MHKTKIGLFGIGLDTYWPQFKGLKTRLKGYLNEVHRQLARTDVEVIDLGLIDSPPKAFEAGHAFRQADVDSLEPVSETTRVVNPEARTLGAQIKSKAAQLSRRQAEYGAQELAGLLEVGVAEEYQSRQTQLRQTIEALEKEVATLKQKRKEVPSHLTLGELPPAERFQQFSRAKKHLVDTIKMVAYRAETALAMSLRQHMARTDDARALLREIFVTAADLCPDETAGTLTVNLHHLSNACSDQLAAKMAEELNATETIFPGTKLQMVFKLVSG